VVSVDALAREIASTEPSAAETPVDHHTIVTSLYHTHLPKMAAVGVVSFDPERGEVQYWSVRRIEELLDLLEEFV
jgi:hypothetical protein